MKKLITILLGAVLSLSGTLPAYAKARKVKLSPEARAAMKRNKGIQKNMNKRAKSRNKELKALKAKR